MAKDKTPREVIQELYATREDVLTTHNQIVRAIMHGQPKEEIGPLDKKREGLLQQEQSLRSTLKKGSTS